MFRAFARAVDEGEQGFVVIDTAPTGHTLLLLDAAESYHREVLRTAGSTPEEVRRLLPRLRDASFTKILLVTLPEATPVHEAAQLERDLARADIRPFGWVVNQSLSPLIVTDPVLVRRRAAEARFLDEVRRLAARVAVVPWSPQGEQPRLDLVNVDTPIVEASGFCHNALRPMARHIEATDLPEDIALKAEAQVAAGRFASVEDVVRAGVEAIATIEQKRAAVRAALREGELSGVFEGDAFASVRAELGLTRQ